VYAGADANEQVQRIIQAYKHLKDLPEEPVQQERVQYAHSGVAWNVNDFDNMDFHKNEEARRRAEHYEELKRRRQQQRREEDMKRASRPILSDEEELRRSKINHALPLVAFSGIAFLCYIGLLLSRTPTK
jgi:hypothetical protein